MNDVLKVGQYVKLNNHERLPKKYQGRIVEIKIINTHGNPEFINDKGMRVSLKREQIDRVLEPVIKE